MKKCKIQLVLIIFALLVSLCLLANAQTDTLEINCQNTVNFGDDFEVSLGVPDEAYGIEATVTVKFSNGEEESKKLVYIESMEDTENLVTFNASIAGEAQITFSNIILCDKYSNVIETEKTLTKTIKIERELTGLSLNYKNATLDLSKQRTLQLSAILTPSDSTDSENVTWSSSDETVVTVDKNGLLTAKGIGIANITVTCKSYKAICDISVTSSMTSLSLNRSNITLYYDEETNQKSLGTLETIISPNNTTDSKLVSWSTSNSSVATVENGIVTPTGIGTATIVAKCNNFTASCEVTVSDNIVNTTLEIKTAGSKSVIYSNSKTTVENFLIEENFPIMLLNSVKLFDSQGNEKSASSRVGSKDVIKILDSQNNVLLEYTIVVPGDVNGDGIVKMYDAFTILKGTLFSGNSDALDILIRDYNGDGVVKMYDAFAFLKYSLFN